MLLLPSAEGGRAGMKAIIGLRCLSVAVVNWTRTGIKIVRRLKTSCFKHKRALRSVREIAKSDLATSCWPVRPHGVVRLLLGVFL